MRAEYRYSFRFKSTQRRLVCFETGIGSRPIERPAGNGENRGGAIRSHKGRRSPPSHHRNVCRSKLVRAIAATGPSVRATCDVVVEDTTAVPGPSRFSDVSYAALMVIQGVEPMLILRKIGEPNAVRVQKHVRDVSGIDSKSWHYELLCCCSHLSIAIVDRGCVSGR